MKKIIGIILAVLMMFSMSTAAFAGFSAVPETPTKDYVKAAIILVENKHEVFETHIVDGKTTEVKGTSAQFVVKLENRTDTPIKWSDVMEDFEIVVKTKFKNGEIKEIDNFYSTPKWLEGGDALGNYINPGTPWGHDFGMKILTQRNVWYEITLGGVTKTITVTEGKADFILTLDKETTTATPTTTVTTTVAPTETTTATPVETTTEAPVETTIITTETSTVEPTEVPTEPTEAPTEAPEIDYEIPNTGSSKMIGAVSALGVAAIAALVISKKKKSNEENWT